MNRRELFGFLEEKIPSSLREEWDNDGVMCAKNMDRAVLRVLCVLDVTDEVVDYAKKGGFDLILSHHPLVFSPLSSVTEDGAVARRVIALLDADIAVFSFHTRLDAVDGGINDALANMLGLQDVKRLSCDSAIGRIGVLPSPLSFSDFCERVKQALGTTALCTRFVKDEVKTVALVGGEGKDFLPSAIEKGADAYLAGRIGYHAMIDSPINAVEAGHYFSERHSALLLNEYVKEIDETVFCEIYTPNPLKIS
ncbi:MAG: Nif3-like dinuclear metal center hexameric protein [Clostridia bacterium]|nr:Nif3-like dinuclear metal center hexameric protein [Clostridia bacterium]